jgi:hypothetical protein
MELKFIFAVLLVFVGNSSIKISEKEISDINQCFLIL